MLENPRTVLRGEYRSPKIELVPHLVEDVPIVEVGHADLGRLPLQRQLNTEIHTDV
jgi:hypothetical protein